MTAASPRSTPTIEADGFPVVDTRAVVAGEPGAAARVADEVRAACEDAAFFFVRDHGVAQTLIDGILAECARCHAERMDDKLKVKVGTDMIGSLPPGFPDRDGAAWQSAWV